MPVKTIAGLAPLGIAVAMAGENIRVAKKKKITSKDMIKLGMTNVLGATFIGASSNLLKDL